LSRKVLSDRRREGGFTMIEAVVTLALVAFVLAAIGSLFASGTIGARTLEQRVALAETARLVATSLPRRRELQTDDFSGEVSGHRWQVRVSPFLGGGQSIPDSPWIPQSVVVRVQSPSGAIMSIETIALQRRPGQ
jgi:general secretion pathway protein I